MNSYRGFLVEQREKSPIKFMVFVAKAKDVVRWAHADNIRLDRGNVQRELVEARWRQIKKFFDASPNNVIPTSITIAFDEEIPQLESIDDLQLGTIGYHIEELNDGMANISFNDDVVEAAFIIDGQHRLRGMSVLDFDVKIPICLFLSISRLERAFQFVTINNKSHKVPTDNLKALIANFEQIQSDLRKRLTQASISVPRFSTFVDILNEDPESPFFKMVDWVNNRFEDANPVVQPTALENSLRAIVRAFPETKEDETDALVVLNAIWRTIFNAYDISYENAVQFPNLMLKATIQKITEMIVEKLRSDHDPVFSDIEVTANDGKASATISANFVKGIPEAFWKDPWMLKSLDTSAGREIIERDIRELKLAIFKAKGDEIDWKAFCNLYRTPSED